MALVKLGGGIELDIATGDELRGGLADMQERLLGKRDPRPNYLSIPGQVSGSSATTPTATVTIGMPPAGRLWNVLAATIVGNNDHGAIASPAGFMAMYFGDPFNPSLAQLGAVKLTLPSTTFFTSDVLWCPSGQYLFFQSDLALNAPDQIVVVATVAEWRAKDVEMADGR